VLIRRSFGVALVAVLLAGCATATSTTTKTISADGGALVIQPAKAQPVVYGKQAAVFDLEHSVRFGAGWALKEIDFGYVTITHRIAGGAVATPEPRLAWVLFYNPGAFASAGPSQSGPITCPGGETVRPAVAGRTAMVVDAMNEASFLYTGAGTTNCGIATRPVVGFAYQEVSVPWVDLGGDRVQASYPGCVTGGDGTPSTGVRTATRSEWRMAVLGHRAIGPCTSPPTTRVLELGMSAQMLREYPRPWIHEPTGPLPGGVLTR
jgi:hypothetical protein